MKSAKDYRYNFREFKKLETSVFYPVARWLVKTLAGETDSNLPEYLSGAGRWEKFLLYLEARGFVYGGTKMTQLSAEKINERFSKVLEKLNQEKEKISKTPLSDLEEIIRERKRELVQLVKDGVPRKTICILIYEEFSDLCGDKPPSVRWLNKILGTQNVTPKKKIVKSESKESKIAEVSNGSTSKRFDSLG